ncbi:condensation domain-containing protein [Streptomyces violaceusniger]|uniref:condensation domain-containing protein n=1 Tax=Streptomyces violaceusniger TaxID=68280 RepID=UPI0034202AC8
MATDLTPRERILCELLANLFGVPSVVPDDDFVRLGGDSIIAVQVVGRARRAGLRLTVRDVLALPDVATLAAAAEPLRESPVDRDGGDPRGGAIRPTPIMHWLRERGGPADTYYQYLVVRTPAELTLAGARSVVQALLDRHDVLRLKVTGDAVGEMVPLPVGAVRTEDCVTAVNTEGLGPEETLRLVRHEMIRARDRLSPRDGAVVQVVWCDAGRDAPGRMAIVINHLVVDGISWRILTDDLATAWEAVSAGRDPHLSPVPTSFGEWSRLLAAEAMAPRRTAELSWWEEVVRADVPGFGSRPLDPVRDLEERAGRIDLTLPAAVTVPLLTSVTDRLRADANEVLLAGLALALAEWQHRDEPVGRRAVLIDVEGHGREEIADDVDISRTVGWFTSMFPVRFELDGLAAPDVHAGGCTVGTALRRVKEHLREIPDKGIGYGLLRHLNPVAGQALAGAPVPGIGFNYLGRFPLTDARDWRVLPEHGIQLDAPAPGMPMAHAVEVGAITLDHADGPALHAHWAWAKGVVTELEIHALAASWFRMLEALVAHAECPDVGGLSPADVAVAAMDQDELDELEASLDAL